MLKQIVDFFENFTLKRLILIAIVLILLIMIYPFLDANFLYFNRIENRIEVLTKLQGLDQNFIASNTTVLTEYNDILNIISEQDQSLFLDNGNILAKSTTDTERILKFISGSFWILLMILLSPFIFKKFIKTIQGILVLILCTIPLGGVGVLIPLFNQRLINYLGYPLIQLIILIGFVYKYSEKKKAA